MFDLIPWKRKKESPGGVAVRDTFENPFGRIRHEFNELAERMFRDWPGLTGGMHDSNWGWSFDVEDQNGKYVVRAEAPGFEASDFDVQINGNQLVIRAERQSTTDDNGGMQTSRRSLHRSIVLPDVADIEKADARYQNGILELQLPKTPSATAKRVTVKAR